MNDTPTAKYIQALAAKHRIQHQTSQLDQLANKITELSGDEVTKDPTLDLIVLLKRTNHLTKEEAAKHTITHLKQRIAIQEQN